MRIAHMPALVRRSSSWSLTPGFTTATPLASLPRAFIAFKVTVLSSPYALGCTTMTRSRPSFFCSSRYIGTVKWPGFGVPGFAFSAPS
jgi:hypothetical protein